MFICFLVFFFSFKSLSYWFFSLVVWLVFLRNCLFAFVLFSFYTLFKSYF